MNLDDDIRHDAAVDPEALAALLQMTGDDRSFLRELVEIYLDDAPTQLEAMRSAVAGGDAEQLRRAAHTLKSNSSNMGAIALAEHCREVEALARLGDVSAAGPTVLVAETEFVERVAPALQGLVPEVPET